MDEFGCFICGKSVRPGRIAETRFKIVFVCSDEHEKMFLRGEY